MIRPVTMALLAVLLADPALAVQAGDRVRATLIAQPKPRVVGTLLSYHPESITLANSEHEGWERVRVPE